MPGGCLWEESEMKAPTAKLMKFFVAPANELQLFAFLF